MQRLPGTPYLKVKLQYAWPVISHRYFHWADMRSSHLLTLLQRTPSTGRTWGVHTCLLYCRDTALHFTGGPTIKPCYTSHRATALCNSHLYVCSVPWVPGCWSYQAIFQNSLTPSSQGPEFYTNPHSTLPDCSPLSPLNFKIQLS